MSESLLVLFSSPRNSDHTVAGVNFVRNPPAGKRLIILLMQDAVLLALKGLSGTEDAFSNVSEAYVLAEHLEKRGFSPESLRQPFKVLDYEEVIDLMMTDGVSVVGCF